MIEGPSHEAIELVEVKWPGTFHQWTFRKWL